MNHVIGFIVRKPTHLIVLTLLLVCGDNIKRARNNQMVDKFQDQSVVTLVKLQGISQFRIYLMHTYREKSSGKLYRFMEDNGLSFMVNQVMVLQKLPQQ